MYSYVFTAQGISQLDKIFSTVTAPEAFSTALSPTQTQGKNPNLKIISNLKQNKQLYMQP